MLHHFRTALQFCLPALACLIVGSAVAHEFWLLPRFWVAPGTTQSVRVYVGENFTGERWAGKSARVTRLMQYAPAGPQDLTAAATAADSLRTSVTFAQPGTHLLTLATNNAFITLEADKFNTYLKEEGLDNALLLRQKRGELTMPGREAYRRCAKTLVQAGPASSADTARAWSRPTGMPLELVPEQNPYALKTGASFTVRVLADGKPVPGQLVQVWQQTPGRPVKITKFFSNQNGRLLFYLSGPGSYMVSTVRMEPTRSPAADWQSTWSSLTFGFGTPARR